MSDQANNIQNEAETGFLSLAELAAMNTDEIAVLTSRLPAEGIFLVRCTELGISESQSTDPTKPPLWSVNFGAEILEAKPLNKDTDPETLVGRNIKERYTLWPVQFKEALGLLKGRYKTVGLDYSGNLGGVEGQEPGWLDNAVNATFRIRVRHFTDKNKNERAGFDWLPAEDKKAA